MVVGIPGDRLNGPARAPSVAGTTASHTVVVESTRETGTAAGAGMLARILPACVECFGGSVIWNAFFVGAFSNIIHVGNARRGPGPRFVEIHSKRLLRDRIPNTNELSVILPGPLNCLKARRC